MNDQLTPFVVSAAIIAYLQKTLKKFGFYQSFVKSFPGSDKWAHRAFAAVASFIAAVGVNYTWTGDYSTGWNLSVDIPGGMILLQGVWDWTKIYIFQQLAYDVTVTKEKVIMNGGNGNAIS